MKIYDEVLGKEEVVQDEVVPGKETPPLTEEIIPNKEGEDGEEL